LAKEVIYACTAALAGRKLSILGGLHCSGDATKHGISGTTEWPMSFLLVRNAQRQVTQVRNTERRVAQSDYRFGGGSVI
jgi:hypothetical protein